MPVKVNNTRTARIEFAYISGPIVGRNCRWTRSSRLHSQTITTSSMYVMPAYYAHTRMHNIDGALLYAVHVHRAKRYNLYLIPSLIPLQIGFSIYPLTSFQRVYIYICIYSLHIPVFVFRLEEWEKKEKKTWHRWTTSSVTRKKSPLVSRAVQFACAPHSSFWPICERRPFFWRFSIPPPQRPNSIESSRDTPRTQRKYSHDPS